MRGSVARTLFVFAGLGPPIGLVTFSLSYAAWFLHAVPFETNLQAAGALLGFHGFVASYILGLIPAVVSGGFVAWTRKRRSRYEPPLVGFIGLLVGVAYTLFWYMQVGMPLLGMPAAELMEPHSLLQLYIFFLLTLTCVISTLVCWAIARRMVEVKGAPA